ncbi:MAG: hypothetical protein WB525_02905, partial [Pseudolabrys sp.]
FPVSREFGSGDGFDLDCVRHQAFQQLVYLTIGAADLLPTLLPMIGIVGTPGTSQHGANEVMAGQVNLGMVTTLASS